MGRIAMLLWLGEMRVQRLISRRPAIAAAQVLLVASILVFLAIRVRDAVATGHLAVTNIAVLSAVGAFLIFANVIVTGEESHARVTDIRRWVQPLPVSRRQLRGLLAAMGVLRGALFTATLIGTTAVGSLLVRDAWGSRLEVISAALVLPLLPVAAGLWFGARRSGPVPSGFVTAPMGAAVLAIAVPLPQAHGALLALLRLVAAPGLALIGAATPGTAIAVLVLWLCAAAWFLTRLDRVVEASTVDDRPPLAARLSDGPNGRRIAADVVLHRVRPRDVVEIALLTTLLAAVALLVLASAAGASSTTGALTIAALALPVTVVGYRHLRAVTVLDADADAWLRSVPLPAGALAWVRHLVAVASATAAIAVFLAVLGSAGFAGLRLPSASLVVILLTPLSLTGWIGLASTLRGLTRVLLYLGLSQLIGARLLIMVVLSVLGGHAGIAAVLIIVDFGVGLLGHLAMRHRAKGL